eukprot:707250-Amphidinium_carterae.1
MWRLLQPADLYSSDVFALVTSAARILEPPIPLRCIQRGATEKAANMPQMHVKKRGRDTC